MRAFALAATLVVLLEAASAYAQAPQTTNAQLPGVSIRFLGFTRNVRGAAAVFWFSNSSPQLTLFQVNALEYKTENGWNKSSSGFWLGVGFSSSLARSSAVVREFDVHDTNLAWRVSAFCVEHAAGLARVPERGKELLKTMETGKPVEVFSGRKYLVTSSDNPTYGVLTVGTTTAPHVVGVGMVLHGSNEGEWPKVEAVLPGGPAARAGIQVGWSLLSINGSTTVGKSLRECVSLVRGEEDTLVALELVDTLRGRTNQFSLKREPILTPQK